ncbi:MAG: NUDIX domain-containing protein, partial [Clostridiales bacterium]|nr:NUDIX domain-containing protein [Clostridiales bacterium]
PPESKVEEVKTFQAIPDKLTEPEVIAEIYDSLEKWLGLKGKHEYWDVYDENRQHTGRIHQRGVPMEKGDYHIVVRAWIVNSKGEFLITRRAFNKISYPGMWESPTGSVTCGEDSFTAVLREIQEETGIILYPERGELFTSYIQANAFFDNWLFRQEFDLASVILQENETIDARKATWNEISEMIARGEFMGRDVFQEFDMLKGIAGL